MGRRVDTAAGPLRPGVPGTPPGSDLTVPQAVALMAELIPAATAPATADKMLLLLRRWQHWCQAHDLRTLDQVQADDVERWLTAPTAQGEPPQVSTRRGRRAALRLGLRLLRQQGLAVGDPTLDIVLPARADSAPRPLLQGELALCELAAASRSRTGGGFAASVLALATATATSSEIPRIRIQDLDNVDSPTAVALPGSGQHHARTGALTEWGSVALARRVQHLLERGAAADTPLAYRGTAGGAASQAAACVSLRQVLNDAGLRGQENVRPGSVRNGAGRRLYDSGKSLLEVADAMGMRSLDRTCRLIDVPLPAADRYVRPTGGGR